MFQAQNRETINSSWKVYVSFKIIMTTSLTRPCFKTQHQTCKTKTKTVLLVWNRSCLWDRSCPKTDSLWPHHCQCPNYRLALIPRHVLELRQLSGPTCTTNWNHSLCRTMQWDKTCQIRDEVRFQCAPVDATDATVGCI